MADKINIIFIKGHITLAVIEKILEIFLDLQLKINFSLTDLTVIVVSFEYTSLRSNSDIGSPQADLLNFATEHLLHHI